MIPAFQFIHRLIENAFSKCESDLLHFLGARIPRIPISFKKSGWILFLPTQLLDFIQQVVEQGLENMRRTCFQQQLAAAPDQFSSHFEKAKA